MENLNALRKEYLRGSLEPSQIGDDPLGFFKNWLDEALAADLDEPNAMVLSTVGADARPSSRVVLLKELKAEGLVFFTHYSSRKGHELSINHHASVLFFWPRLERQVRFEGVVEKLPAEESDRYFRARPLESRAGALASPQSQVIPSYEWLSDRFNMIMNEISGATNPEEEPVRPATWGGYLLRPDHIEFWQGGPHRLHHRIDCLHVNDVWQISRLAP